MRINAAMEAARAAKRRGGRALAIVLALAALTVGAPLAWAQDEESAPEPQVEGMASDATLTVAVFSGARPDACYDSGYADAIARLTRREVERVNASGLLGGRRLEVALFDGDPDAETAIAGMREALETPNLIGLVGMTRSRIATESFAEMGEAIAANGAPFMSGVRSHAIIAPYPNVFTMRVSQEDEQIPAIRAFLREQGFERPALIGRDRFLAAKTLADGLAEADPETGEGGLVYDRRLRLKRGERPDPALISEIVAELRAASADVVVLMAGGSISALIMKEMKRVGAAKPVFLFGRIGRLFRRGGLAAYPSPIYQLAWSGAPHIQSERLRRLIGQLGDGAWLFGGVKNEASPRWAEGRCREAPDREWRKVYAPRNLRAATRGAEYADMIGLIAHAAAGAPRDADIAGLRAHVVETIKQRFSAGTGAYEGQAANWSFRSDARTVTRTPIFLERAVGASEERLAPIQFVRLRGDALRRVPTFFMDVDLVRIFRVDDNENTFFADMYVSLAGEGATIDKLEFANAFLDPETNRRTIEIVEVHDGGVSDAYPRGVRLYRVSGRFMFDPDFSLYPFDSQRFAIELQPKRAEEAMILQPPAPGLRDQTFETDGWSVREQYVSYDEDFTPLVDARNGARSIAPYYKASFVWLMDRQATDYYLRVAVPLILILGVAYFSIFIAKDHFEAIVTIQVTALLSAVALYLAIPKVDTATATLSDKIFLVDYMAVFLMIAVSVLRMNRLVRRLRFVTPLLVAVHVLAVPVMVGLMAQYVYEVGLPTSNDAGELAERASGEEPQQDTEASVRAR